MKRILLLLSILSLVAVGCNREEQQPAGSGTGMQEEQQIPSDTQDLPADSEYRDVEGVEPSMQEMEASEIDDPALDDSTMQDDSGMQEEEFRNRDVDTMDTSDERDLVEPTDESDVQR